MALPSGLDRVRVVKQEYAEYGGDAADEDEWGGVPLDPSEDVIDSAGGVVQRAGTADELVGWYRVAGASPASDELALFDPVSGEKKLSELGGGSMLGRVILKIDGGIAYSTEGHPCVKVNQ